MPASTSTGEWVIARVGGAPVVISPTSLLLGLLIAGSWYPLVSSALGGFGTTTVLLVVVSTVLGVAVSVLLHELAHGLSGTLMGRRPTRYELYLWGGRTSFGPAREWTAWKDLVTSLSGPATNLLIWGIGTWAQNSVSLPVPVAFTIWAVTLVNLALAVFNALPGLPLDGGYALAALVVQVTGNRRLGLKVAGWGGLAVVGGVVWWWILRPLVLDGRQPDAFNLILVLMVGWSIVASSWQVLELGGGARAASKLDLRELARPLRVVGPETPVSQVREALAQGAALVLVTDGSELVGTIDAAALKELGLSDAAGSTPTPSARSARPSPPRRSVPYRWGCGSTTGSAPCSPACRTWSSSSSPRSSSEAGAGSAASAWGATPSSSASAHSTPWGPGPGPGR